METVSNIFLKSDKSFEINEISQVPLVFNYNVYNYYLSLLSFSYLNCSPNIYETQTLTFRYWQVKYGDVNPTIETVNKTIQAGLYDTQDLIDLFNEWFNLEYYEPAHDGEPEKYTYGQVLNFAVNPFNERVEIKFDTTEASKVKISQVAIDVTAYAQTKCVLNNNLFRFDIGTIFLNQGHPSYVSTKAFRISTYNNVMLTSSSIPGLVSLYGSESDDLQTKGITTSSALYVISSVSSPYSMVEYTAIQPVDFPLNGVPSLSNFQFKLVDENNNDLKLLPNSTPDFSIKLAIKRYPKITVRH